MKDDLHATTFFKTMEKESYNPKERGLETASTFLALEDYKSLYRKRQSKFGYPLCTWPLPAENAFTWKPKLWMDSE